MPSDKISMKVNAPSSCSTCFGKADTSMIIPKFSHLDRGHAQCNQCKMTFDSDIEEILGETLSREKILGIESREDYMRLFVETWKIGDSDNEEVYPRFGWEDNEVMRKGVAAHIIKSIEEFSNDNNSVEILDVGCGTGFTTIELAAKFGASNILGIDPSPSVGALPEKYSIPAVQGTLDTIELPSESRDVVVVVGNLMLHRDPGFTLKECHRILRPGGLVIADYKNINSIARKGALMIAKYAPKRVASKNVIQRNFVNMRYGMGRDHMDRFIGDAGLVKLSDYSKPPRLLEFSNVSEHQVGTKGIVWRLLNWIDGIFDNKAWIQFTATKR